MENSAETAAKQIIVFLALHDFLDTVSIRRKEYNLLGLELEISSMIKSAYGEADDSIPFTEDL